MNIRERIARLFYGIEIRELEWKLKNSQTDTHILKQQLEATKKTIKSNGNALCNMFLKLNSMPIHELRDKYLQSPLSLMYCTTEGEESAKWNIVTQICCLGGCDMGVITVDSERDALILALFLTEAGFVPYKNHTACSTCYEEYIKDCI